MLISPLLVFFTNKLAPDTTEYLDLHSIYTLLMLRKLECEFFTATILEWKHLLKRDAYKEIIIDSLRSRSFGFAIIAVR